MQAFKDYNEYLRRKHFNKIVILLFQLFIFSSFIFIWQFCSNKRIINPFIFSSPSKILSTIVFLLKNESLLFHIFTTIKEVFIAFLLGGFIGFIVSIFMYLFPTFYKVFEPYLTIINSLPKVALGPIIIIWFGANTNSIIIMALLINLILNIQNIITGLYSIDKYKILMMKSIHANKIQTLLYLVIPNSYETIISSLKVNVSMTLVGVIMGEFLVSKAGIGYLIIYGTQIFDLNIVISGIIILGFISFILYGLVSIIERILIK